MRFSTTKTKVSMGLKLHYRVGYIQHLYINLSLAPLISRNSPAQFKITNSSAWPPT